MIKAENGVLNLKQMLFNGNMQKESQISTRETNVDSFARTLENKVSERIDNRRLKEKVTKPYEDSNVVEKKKTTISNDRDRMPKTKVNNEKELKSIDEKLDELKKALDDSKGKTTSEIEEMLADLLGTQEMSDNQLMELEAMMQGFMGMEDLELSQPILDVLDQLPDELVKKINQLFNELTNGQDQIMTKHGNLEEKVSEIITSIEKTLENLELDGEVKSQEDLVNVLKMIKDTLGEAVEGDKVVNVESASRVENLSEVFKIVESIEKKESSKNVEKLQSLMNQNRSAVEVNKAPEQVENDTSSDLNSESKSQLQEGVVNTTLSEATEKEVPTESVISTKEVATEEVKESPRDDAKEESVGFKEEMNSQISVKTDSQAVVEQTSEQMTEIKETAEVIQTQTVKVAQTHRNIMNQVVDASKMSFNLEDETSEMLIKLKPHSLGNVELKVSIDKGVMVAEFNVESQVVKEALEANLADLRNALSDKGFNIHELNVSVNQDQNGKQQQQFGRRPRGNKSNIEMSSIEHVFESASLESLNNQSTIDFLG